MCQKVQKVTHNSMHSFFGTLARVHLKWNRWICFFFVLVYIGISNNLTNFKEFANQDAAFAPENCTAIWNKHRYDETFRNSS